jgi:hypothetical protein
MLGIGVPSSVDLERSHAPLTLQRFVQEEPFRLGDAPCTDADDDLIAAQHREVGPDLHSARRRQVESERVSGEKWIHRA